MENKLVFKPQTLTAYNWIKYNLIESRTYKWDKYQVAPEYLHHYFWNKYSIIKDTNFYIWRVYDTSNNYLGEIGSYNKNAYPQDGEATLNGVTRKFIYRRAITNGNTGYAWDEYDKLLVDERVTTRVYNQYELNTVPNYCWKRYHQDNYGYLSKRIEKITGTQATSVSITSVNHANISYLENISSIQATIYLHDNKKLILTKNKPSVISSSSASTGYVLTVSQSGSIEIDIDTLNNDVLLNYIAQGYKYWVPSKFYNSSVSGRYNTILNRGFYFEFLNETYYQKGEYYDTPYFLENILLRTTLAHYSSAILENREYGNISSEGVLVSSKATCYNYYKRTGLREDYNKYSPNRNEYPDNDFFGLMLYVFYPEGEGTTQVAGDFVKEVTTKNDDTSYPSNGKFGDYYYILQSTTTHTIINTYIGDYIGRRYSATRDFYTDRAINPTTSTYFIYRGEIDIRFNHKWFKYHTDFGARQNRYQWLVYNWNFNNTNVAWASLIGYLESYIQLHPEWLVESNGTYYFYPITKITEESSTEDTVFLGIFNKLIGAYDYTYALGENNQVIENNSVRTDYYNTTNLPSIIIDNALSINDDSYSYTGSYLAFTMDENNKIISGKGYMFSIFPYITGFFPGAYIEEVTSPYIGDYPEHGVACQFLAQGHGDTDFDEDYYIYQGTVNNDGVQGDFIEKIETNIPNVYPNNGAAEGFWWVYQPNDYYKEIVNWIRQDKVGSVTAVDNLNAYPEDGVFPNDFVEGTHYYYRYTGYTSAYSQGIFNSRVKTYIRTSYPDNSYVINDGWYIYSGETIEQTAELTIDKTQLMGGVNYTQEINPSEDLLIGATGSAQVDFTIYAPDAAAATQYLGKDFEYYVKMNSDSDWRKIGTFILTTAELPDKQTAKIQGFDFINRFDVIVDEWLFNLSFPLTLGELFVSLCEYVGCEAYSTSFTNSDFLVNDNFEAVQITGRTILQYITEVSGGFCVAEPDGRIRIRYYAKPKVDVNLGNNSYKKYTHEIYNVPVITSIIVRKDDNDEGVESNV